MKIKKIMKNIMIKNMKIKIIIIIKINLIKETTKEISIKRHNLKKMKKSKIIIKNKLKIKNSKKLN
jgi:hypothetical protein